MPRIRPTHAIQYASPADADLSSLIAPPYDVLDVAAKQRLLAINGHNIVAIDLPHLPAKSAGPDHVYQEADRTFRRWLQEGVLTTRSRPALFVYQQTFRPTGSDGEVFRRRGLMANVAIQPFGASSGSGGGIHPHEQTFSGPKEDRMKLMCATRAQLSPIFGLYSDAQKRVSPLLQAVVASGRANFKGHTAGDGVDHEVWVVDDPDQIARFSELLAGTDVFIADGHHRYTTAMNYRQRLIDAGELSVADKDHPAHSCLFVLVSMQDPGMIVLPTHRVLGGMTGYTREKLIEKSRGVLNVTPFAGDNLEALAAALPQAGPHAMGLFDPAEGDRPLAIATTVQDDPLGRLYATQSRAWRQLDVAILQHLIVEEICQPQFCSGDSPVSWKFPHTLEELKTDTHSQGYQLGVIMQATPLESVRQISEAGELMPQKSTFFYPKLATGLVIHPLYRS